MEWGKPSKIRRSPGFIEPCVPTLAKAPPAGDGWLHEIKHDGYRLVVRRTGKRVRIFTRRGYDRTERFPRIVEAVAGLRADSIVLDGEAVVCGPEGIADFALLHAKQVNPRRSSTPSTSGSGMRHPGAGAGRRRYFQALHRPRNESGSSTRFVWAA